MSIEGFFAEPADEAVAPPSHADVIREALRQAEAEAYPGDLAVPYREALRALAEGEIAIVPVDALRALLDGQKIPLDQWRILAEAVKKTP